MTMPVDFSYNLFSQWCEAKKEGYEVMMQL